jgi:phosphoglycolate phosphatase
MGSSPCLVFDLDGTLSDPAVGVLRSINHSLSHFHHAEISAADISTCIGPPIDQTFTRLSGSDDPAYVRALVARYRERYSDVGYAENVLYEGIPGVLAALHQRGVAMGVCTSKRVDFAERILTMFSLRSYFRFVSGGEDGASKAAHLGSLVYAGTVPKHAIMIGDRAVDIEAAHSNGLTSAGVLWGHGSEAELRGAGAHHLLRSPRDILALTTLR